jgi:signal transduction histidine kinase
MRERDVLIAFILAPHFWQTFWFKSAMALLPAMIVASAFLVRRAQRRQIEKLRLKIAADLHDEVGSNLGSISLLSRMIQNSETLTTEERKDVALINRVSKETANSIKDIVWFTNPQFDTLHDLVMRMQDVARTLLTGIECHFENHIENGAARLSLDFRQNIFLIFKESLANILKHSQATCVKLEVLENDGLCTLRITDNGRGFDAASIEKGNGLVNLRRRTEQLKGTIEIKSEPNRGTTILLSARLQRRLWARLRAR